MAESSVDPKATQQSFDAALPPDDMPGEFDVRDTSETEFFSLSPRTKGQAPNPTPDPQAPVPDSPGPGAPEGPTDPDVPDGGEPSPAPAPDLHSENLLLKQQLAELSLYKPLGDMISRNPNFLTAVEASLKSLPNQAEPEPPKIERPQAPQKPAGYDAAEALSAPGSESWKYREAQEAYTGALFEYYEARDARREEMQARQMKQLEAESAQMRARDELTHELTTRFGYTNERVEDFIRTMSDPNSRSIENLVALHQMQTQKKGERQAQSHKAAQKNVPLPVGITGGGGAGTAGQLSVDQLFNMGLGSARR